MSGAGFGPGGSVSGGRRTREMASRDKPTAQSMPRIHSSILKSILSRRVGEEKNAAECWRQYISLDHISTVLYQRTYRKALPGLCLGQSDRKRDIGAGSVC